MTHTSVGQWEDAPTACQESSHRPAFPPLGPEVKALLVWPRFPDSFWSFHRTLELVPEKAVHPPLGLITVAALCPKGWRLRLVDRSIDELTDDDLRWAELVMLTGMAVQRDDMCEILRRARALGRRTILGGPFASSEPETLLPLADHVVVGEPDEVFPEIARDLEQGTARRLYRVKDKPDVSKTPAPRFDLLKMEKYVSMAVQFSRGCPFQCEFCDIITIYGRKPRTKPPAQLLRELDRLYELGWRDQVFLVDDNFIGNHKRALELVLQMEEWQKQHGYPFLFYTEASVDLAQRSALMEAMVRANFAYVFLGIESPSREALTETKKFQNLQQDPLECVRTIQHAGMWVTAGFIIGFDSDTEDIFQRQIEFIERAAIPWAMTGFLVAVPTTPLYDRMVREGRLIPGSSMTSNFKPPNFHTRLPTPILLQGVASILRRIYHAEAFYERALRSLENWRTQGAEQAPARSLGYTLRMMYRSILDQGVRSFYRKAYWKFLFQLVRRYSGNPQKMWLGSMLLLSGHHFIQYARDVAAELGEKCRGLAQPGTAETVNRGERSADRLEGASTILSQ